MSFFPPFLDSALGGTHWEDDDGDGGFIRFLRTSTYLMGLSSNTLLLLFK